MLAIYKLKVYSMKPYVTFYAPIYIIFNSEKREDKHTNLKFYLRNTWGGEKINKYNY